jgi:hypothetical protein
VTEVEFLVVAGGGVLTVVLVAVLDKELLVALEMSLQSLPLRVAMVALRHLAVAVEQVVREPPVGQVELQQAMAVPVLFRQSRVFR